MSLQVWLPLNGNLNNQGLNGSVTVTNNGATVDSSGKIGSCYSFDGSNDYISFGPQTLLNGNFSVCAWYYHTGSAAWGRVFEISTIDNAATGNKTCIGIGLGNDGNTLSLFGRYNDSYNPSNVTIQTVSSGIWYHVGITVDNTSVKCYVNGTLKVTSTLTTSLSGITFPYCYIGKSSWTSDKYLNGKENDFRFYDHCLSVKEVKEISQGLVLHYKLDNNGCGMPNLLNTENPISSGNYVTISNKKVIIPITTTAYDIYFFFNLKTSLTSGKTYTLSFDCSGLLSDNISFRWSNVDTSPNVSFKLKNGINSFTFIMPSNETRTFLDDVGSHTISSEIILSNFKIEESSIATPWCPNSSDTLYTTLGLNSTVEKDCSGYENDASFIGDISPKSSSVRFLCSEYLNSTNVGTSTSSGAAYIKGIMVNPIVSPTRLSIVFWSNLTNWSYQSSGILSISNNSSSPTDYTTSILNQYDGVFRSGNSSTSVSLSASNLIVNDTWHQYAFIYNGSTWTDYRDGVAIDSVSLSSLANFQYIYIGLSVAGGAWRQTCGYWSDFRIYCTALSADDIKELYTNSASIDKSGNLHCYQMIEE